MRRSARARQPDSSALSDDGPEASDDNVPDADDPHDGPPTDGPRADGSPILGSPGRPGDMAAGRRAVHRPSPAHLAELAGSFAMTANVHDPESSTEAVPDQRYDDVPNERGLRGLVGGGSSQVIVTAAMRARDAARPTEADLAAAESSLPIVRRGWVPREELPRTTRVDPP